MKLLQLAHFFYWHMAQNRNHTYSKESKKTYAFKFERERLVAS